MGGKLKRPLTPAEKRKRVHGLNIWKDHQRAALILTGACLEAFLIMLFKDIGL